MFLLCWAHWLCGRSRSPPRSALPGLRADGLTRHSSNLEPYQVVPSRAGRSSSASGSPFLIARGSCWAPGAPGSLEGPLIPTAPFSFGAWSSYREVELANVQSSSPLASWDLCAVSVHRHLSPSIVRSVLCMFDGPCPFVVSRFNCLGIRWLAVEVLLRF